MENRPQCHTQTKINVMSTIAPLFPKTSMNICATGCPTGEATVRSKSCMGYKSQAIHVNSLQTHLNGEEEGKNDEETKYGTDTDGSQDTNRGTPSGVLGLFGQVSAGIKSLKEY